MTIYLLLLCMLSTISPVRLQYCVSNSQCNPGNTVVCGVCDDNRNPGRARCYFPFDYKYPDKNANCRATTDCVKGCSSRGRCLTHLKTTTPFCVCDQKYQGHGCELPVPPELITKRSLRGFGVASDVIFKPGGEYSIRDYYLCNPEFILTREHFNGYVEATVYNDRGGYGYKTFYSLGSQSGSGVKNPKCVINSVNSELYYGLIFPYEVYNLESTKRINFLTLGDEVVGYVSKMTYTARQWPVSANHILWTWTWNVLVHYQATALTCVPVIQLRNCGLTKERSSTYYRFANINIASQITYIQNGRYKSTSVPKPECAKNARMSWTVYKELVDGYIEHLDYRTYEEKDLTLPSYRLTFGYYKAIFEIKNVQPGQSVINRAVAYFNVQPLPLLAFIDGGSEMRLRKNDGILLSSKMSGDPNSKQTDQDHVYATWSCEDLNNPDNKPSFCNAVTMKVSEVHYIHEDQLSYDSKYRFWLKVWTNRWDRCDGRGIRCDTTSPKYASVEITIPKKEDEGEDSIWIQCIRNCGVKMLHNQQLFLKAVSRGKIDLTGLKWTVLEGNTELEIGDLILPNLPPFMLILDELKLKMGTEYIVDATIPSLKHPARRKFQTEVFEYEGNCTVDPTSGVKGETLFNIECDPGNGDLTFDFYNKHPEETNEDLMFSGRMLGSSTSGLLQNVKLTRPKVFVFMINRVGLFKHRMIDVTLQDKYVDDKILDEIFSDLDRVMAEGNDMQTMQFMSAVSEIVPDSMEKSKVLDRLLSSISSMASKYFPEIKMTTSTLSNILVELNRPKRLGLSPGMMRGTLALMRRNTEWFSRLVADGESVKAASPKELMEIAQVQLDALNNALISRDPGTVDKDPDDFDFKSSDDLVKGSINAEKTLELIQDVLGYIQSPGQPPIHISSSNKDINMWALENDDDFPLTNYLDSTQFDIPVKLNPDGMNSLKKSLKSEETLALQVSSMSENIFWWCKSDVKSNLVSVSVSREHPNEDMIKINDISEPIDVLIQMNPNVQRPVVSDKTVQPDSDKLNPVELDLSVKIHRLDPEAESLTVITFLYPPTKHKLRVYVEPEFRPDYDRMLDKSVIISETSNTYPLPLIHKDDEFFLFMGIIPADDVPVNEEVLYSFRTDSKLCQRWAQGQWSSSGCKISVESGEDEVICSCDHLSIFSAAFPVPPQEIDPFKDAYLFLTVLDNPLVVIFVLCTLFVYLLLCLWAWYRDRKDRYKRNVVILDDNFPGDRYPYLLAVYTSSRFNSGTTANVGLRLFGSISSSRAHILTSKNRRLLRKNSDDWFLIYCSQPLGDLESLHIWHDSAGSDPDWHLDKIIVYSLEENTETVFVFEQWLSLRVNEYPEALVGPYTKSDVTSIKRMFLDNCVFGLRDSHMLLSILLRHPRSEVTRLQRISTLMVGIMVAMLCSIMFYVPANQDELGVDEAQYSVSKRDFYISIQTMVLSVVATILIFFAFKRSYKIIKSERYSRTYTDESYEEKETDRSLYGKFVKVITKTLKSNPLNPVQLPYSQPIVVVRKVWLTIAWVLCIAVILIAAYFVILYSLKMGAAKSKKWLTSLLLTMGEDVFVQGPGRIILISIILSLFLQRVCEVNTHQIALKDVRDLEAPNDDRYLKKLLAKRSHPMYAPLRSDVKGVIVEKRQFYHNCWLTTDFTISLLFVVNVCVAISNLWSSHYYANSQVVTQLTRSSHPDGGVVDFFQVKTIQDLEEFLRIALVRNLYISRWYNEELTQEFVELKQYWNDDYAHTMLGLPMLRQLRVYPKSCRNMVLDGKKQCIPVWSYSAEDNEMYGEGWKRADVSDLNRVNSPWLYKDRSSTTLNTVYRLTGASGRLYDNGGFSVTLGPTRQDTEFTIAGLLDQHWQNLLTKVVFIELSLYNINQDLFSQVTLIVEYHVSGSILTQAQTTSVEGKLQLRAWNVFFVLFFMFYLIRAARVINRAGLLDYMKTYRNVTRMIVLVLCVFCFFNAAFHSFLSMKFNSEFQSQAQSSYFDFDFFIYYFVNLKLFLSILFCVAVVRMVILFRGGRRFLNHMYTIQLSWNWAFWLAGMTFIFIMTLLHVVLIFNIFGGHSVLQIVINQQISHYLSFEEMSSLKVKVFILIKIVCFAVIKSCYLIIFMYNSKIAKTYNLKQSDHFSFITFLCSLLRRKVFRKKSKN